MNLLSSFWRKPSDFYFLNPFPSQHRAGALPSHRPGTEHRGAAGRGLQLARAPVAAPRAQPVPRVGGAGGAEPAADAESAPVPKSAWETPCPGKAPPGGLCSCRVTCLASNIKSGI